MIKPKIIYISLNLPIDNIGDNNFYEDLVFSLAEEILSLRHPEWHTIPVTKIYDFLKEEMDMSNIELIEEEIDYDDC